MKEVKTPKKPLAIYYTVVLLVLLLLNLVLVPWMSERQVKEVDYGTFMSMTEEKNIGRVDIESNQIIFTDKDETQVYRTGLMNDPSLTERLYDAGAAFSSEIVEQTSPILSFLLWFVLPIVLFTALGNFMNKKLMEKMGGPNSMMFGGMGRSNAKVYVQSTEGIHFADVAGEDEAKENLQEVVNYLHDPSKYKDIGAQMPKGILLVGPPGTGKTMLAKAVAGESNVPFFSMSGSEFVEMFVGMGASKVRDLFKQAKEKAPCIVFIDEIDAIGQKRNSGQYGGNDEREQTLNQLLTEMDGFEGNNGVIILAATNRPESLDPALTRPGRFDRQVVVPLPDIRGREQILAVHMKKIPAGPDVDSAILARGTPGFSGADLANLVNEAALFAARRNGRVVTMADFENAKDKIMMGAERRAMVMSEDEKKNTAYHESGHALVARLLPESDPVHKVTIIPRGRALGLTMQLPEMDRYAYNRQYLLTRIAILFGGRIAEEVFMHQMTTGASNDFERATQLARDMVTRYGMSERMGPMVYAENEGEVFLGRSVTKTTHVSERTMQAVDEEVRRIIDEQYALARKLIEENQDKMHAMAHALLEWETIDKEQIDDIMEGRPPRAPRSTEAQENMKPRAPQPAAKPTVKAEEPPAAADAAPTDKLVDTGSDEPDAGSKTGGNQSAPKDGSKPE